MELYKVIFNMICKDYRGHGCGEDKPLSDFPKSKVAKSGYCGKCKACRSNDAKDYYIQNKNRLAFWKPKGLTKDCKRFENIKKAQATCIKTDVQCMKCGNVYLKTDMINVIYQHREGNKYICSDCFVDYRFHHINLVTIENNGKRC